MAVACTYCEEKFNSKRGIYIKCTNCQDIRLCLDCFSAGAEIGEHQSNHPYELVDCGSFSIIDESWKAYEELALLEAIELFGIGSWNDIAESVGTRTAEECSERYLKVYVDTFFGRSAWNAIDKNLYAVTDHTCLQGQPLSPSLSLPERDKIVDITREQQLRLGYMPKRDDFEREYDNDAELLVSKLAVNANDDNELDQDLKIAHINMYTDKLRERSRRKRVVLEYNLVKLFFHMHPEENVDFATSETQKVTTVYDKQSNSTISSPIHKLNRIPADEDVEMTASDEPETNNFKSSHHGDDPQNKSASSNQTPAQNTILNYFRKIDPTNKTDSEPPNNSALTNYFSDLNKKIDEHDFNNMEKKLRIFCQFVSVEEYNRLIRNLARQKELKAEIKELQEKVKSGTGKSPTDACSRLLSEKEKKLCRKSNLEPAQYVSIKAALIRDHSHKKKRGGAKPQIYGNIEKATKKRIVDFLARNNWIKV